jgi:YVTN family beta-propeller protein
LEGFDLKKSTSVGLAVVGILTIGAGGAFAMERVLHAGPQGDGTGVTPVGWRVTPAGSQTTLGALPTTAALSPDGKMLVVLNAGDGTESLQVVDTGDGKVEQTIPYKGSEAVYAGVVFSPDGSHVYASGGGNEKIRTYSVAGGHLTEGASIALPKTNPAGQPVNMYPAGLAITPDGKRLVVADQMADAASTVDIATGLVSTVPVGHNPYGVALSPDGHWAYVSNQGANTVSVLDVSGAAPTVVRNVTVGTHPNRLTVDRKTGTLYVANSESDSISVVAAGADRPSRSLDLSPYRGAPVGSNPDGLVLTANGRTLYVTNSGNNDVAVVDLRSGRVQGMIPTAWYPTSVTLSADGGRLFVTNGKGLGAGPNNGPGYPNPYGGGGSPDQYVGTMMMGTLSTLKVPGSDQLERYSEQVVSNNGFDERDKVRAAASNNPVPARVGQSSPIKHVIYIVKENRTFDQVFGSLGKGNGDPSLNLFGDDSAPNSRALQRKFVTLDNFYANAEVSAQGWNWSVQSNSNPYVEQTWVANYSPRNHGYDYEGGNFTDAAGKNPLDSYIWDRLADRNVSFRNYGFYESGNQLNTGPSGVDPRLAANTDPNFWGWDLTVPDMTGTFTTTKPAPSRYDAWKHEFTQYVANNNLPTVEFLRLPNDHTAGTSPGRPTPAAYVADNDYALGQVVDTVSHSTYWSSTAIFVVEDDAQNGPDHVDAHRTTAQVISPYTQTGRVDSTSYSTVSMLRTIELIAGIKPLTQFDAGATPMFSSFTSHPDFSAYNVTKPSDSVLKQVNGASAPMAAAAAQQNLSREDLIDMTTFNQEVWQSVKGAGSRMPAPQHHTTAPTQPAAKDGDG